jgi:hypothetical protein
LQRGNIDTTDHEVNHGDDGEMMILNGRSNSYGGWKGGHVKGEEGDNDIWYNLAAYTGW